MKKKLTQRLMGGTGADIIVTPIVDAQPIIAKTTTETPDTWAAEAWAWADESGLMSGAPHGAVDRQTLATVLYRYHKEFGETK